MSAVEDENAPLLSVAGGDYSALSAGDTDGGGVGHSQRQEVRAVDADIIRGGDVSYQHANESNSSHAGHTSSETESAAPTRAGPTVTCRICEADIQLEGRTTHVVRCQYCNEVTPIRAAPPGKKYVRCPCNCLLICKASSNRIACPRPNCRRVITLVASAPVGTAVRAPAGTCRVQCCHCQEMFMFNTLANTVANCPHCKKSSSVGANYARSRSLIFFVSFVASLLILLGVVLGTSGTNSVLIYLLWAILACGAAYCLYRLVYFIRLKVSQVLGPI